MVDHTTSTAAIARGVHAAPLRSIQMQINGNAQSLEVATWVTLLDLLRDRSGLTGTKKGCDHVQCGACTVIANGRRINACLTLAVMHDGSAITTVEGLSALASAPQAGKERGLHPFQQAFIQHDALQCGYCTPGQLCSAAALLDEHPCHNEAELRERMSGNLCRCGAYPQIARAVAQVMWNLPPHSADESADQAAEMGAKIGADQGGSAATAQADLA